MSEDDKIGGTLTVKGLMQVAAFLAGGSLLGGGVTYATQPNDELIALKASVDTLALSIADMKADARADRRDRARHEDELKGLERRMRTVEDKISRHQADGHGPKQ
ncbi:MAG: hypothetical protein ACPG6R_10985 [Aequoribacter sp.]|uniref:hypothetical protein n=1 Tax=Aequoribacter sp. TaxID=2847771 RepID=UPI003C372B9D